MEKKYWLQAFVSWDRNPDFIINMSRSQITVEAINYRSSNGTYEYILHAESQEELSELMVEYQSEHFQFESSNLDYAYQYPEGI